MYQLKFHKTLTSEIWGKYPTEQQLLMVANEINRLLNGIKASLELNDLKTCMERIFELIDLTISCQKGNLQKELLRWREIFSANYLLDKKQLKNSQKKLFQLYKTFMFLNQKTAEIL